MKGIKAVSLSLAAVMACPLIFTSCGKEKEDAVNVVVTAQYVSEDTADAVQQALAETFSAESAGFSCQTLGVSTGDSETDPMTAMGGMVKLTGMIASKEIDVLVASLTEGERQAKGESFLALEDLFSEEELAGLDLVSFDIQNDDGTADEENSRPCGIRLYDESIASLDSSGMAVFIVVNTEHRDQAKEVAMELVQLYGESAG